jgi:hypothetical protein
MTLVLDKRFRTEQIDGTGVGGIPIDITQVICEPREGEGTFSEYGVVFEYSSPNETTLAAIREVEAGNVIRCKDEKEFFEQLDSD